MKLFVFFIIGVACAAAQTDCVPQTQEEKAYYQVVSGLEAFAINLYQEVASSQTGNVVVCPLSAAVVLALTLIGARGRTYQEMGDVLHMPLSREIVAQGFRVLMDSLPTATNQSDDDPLVQLANRLYVQNGFSIKESFLQVAVEDFKSGVEKLNFGDSENARNRINQWVANNTNGRIQNLISEDFLTADTRLVLVNAILFSGVWVHPFSESKTQSDRFYLSESDHVNVSMMHGTLRLDYCELPEFNATALRLPYQGRTIQSDMVIVLPNARDGLGPLERNIGQLVFSSMPFQIREVTVSMPTFKTETTIDLKRILQALGMSAMFEEQVANLSGISENPLYVSGVTQKAYISVNENGTEAAAATAVGVSTLLLPQPAVFKADHPFMFFLRIKKNVVFIGRFSNPDQST